MTRGRATGRLRGQLLGMRTDGGNSRDNFTELELVENRSLSGGVKTDHQNSHLLLPPELVEDLGKRETHGCDSDCGVCLSVGFGLRGRSNLLRGSKCKRNDPERRESKQLIKQW